MRLAFPLQLLLTFSLALCSARLFAESETADTYAVMLRVNQGDRDPLYRGWTWIITATAAYSDETGAPVTLQASQAKLTVTDEKGAPVVWPWSASPSTDSLTLDAQNDMAELRWVLLPEQTASLSQGKYAIDLNWGTQAARRVHISVEASPVAPNFDQEVRKHVLLAEASPTAAHVDEALAILDKAIAAKPDALGLLVQKASLAKDAGRLEIAAKSIEDALVLFGKQNPRPTRPPEDLLHLRDEIMNEFLAQTAQGRSPKK